MDGRWIGRDSIDFFADYAYLNNHTFFVDLLGNQILASKATPQRRNGTRPTKPISKTQKSYVYVIGNDALNTLGNKYKSLTANRKRRVSSFSEMLKDIQNTVGKRECISNLLVIAHGDRGHIMRGNNPTPEFKDAETTREAGKKISEKMCKSGKIVIFACEAGKSEELMKAFSASAGVRILANTGNVSISNQTVVRNIFSGTWSIADPKGWYFSLVEQPYNGLLFQATDEWLVYKPDSTVSIHKPTASDKLPVIYKDDYNYLGRGALFAF